MNIPKALEILTLMGKPEFEGHTEDILAARQLGIEALKRYEDLRKYNIIPRWEKLPGETEEESRK